MNKDLYRIVFNRALGLLQVVAEIAHRPGGQGCKAVSPRAVEATVPSMRFALWIALGWVTTGSAFAQAVADPNAPGNQRPTVINAPNGVPVVNIQTPSADGVSRNSYRQFDVNAQGAILNNSRTNVQTQLGGWVQGNPWLATGTARGLQAVHDINVIGSTVTAGEVLNVQAGGNVTVASTTQKQQGGGYRQHDNTNLNRVAGLYVTNPGGLGVLNVNAGGDVTLQAAQVANAGTNGITRIAAGGDLNLTTLTTSRSTNTTAADGDYRRSGTTTQVGTTVQGAGDVVLQAGHNVNATAAQVSAGQALAVVAGNDINSLTAVDTATANVQDKGTKHSLVAFTSDETVKGSQFTAGGNIALQAGQDINLQAASVVSEKGGIALAAGRDVNLTAASEQHAVEVDASKKKSGFLSSKTTTTHDKVVDNIAVGTVLSGETVQIGAGRDVTAQGAQVVGTGDVTVVAGRDLTLDAAESTHSETHNQSTKKSGLMGTGGVGIMVGSRSQAQGLTVHSTTAEGTLLGSLEGNVTLVAGEDAKIRGSDVISATGTDIVGKTVTIESAEETLEQINTTQVKSSGLELSLSGTAVNAAMGAYQGVKRAGETTGNSRLAALNLAAAGYAAKDAYGLYQHNPGAKAASGSTNGMGSPQNEAVNLKLGIAASSASSKTVVEQTTQHGSTIKSGGDVNVISTEGDLTVTGSTISGKNVTLDSARDLILQSAEETMSQHSTSQSGSAGVGILIGQSGFGFYVEGSAARGKADGDDVSHAETLVNASDTLTLRSARDTTLQGAQVAGETVKARIGGDLKLISEQDTSVYKNKDQSASGQVVIGYGSSASASYNQSKIDSDYASVTQQTGIQAGSGGYDIDVKGGTTLTGAAIASTADASKNRLSTDSLTITDIKNKAEYEASSIGVSASSSWSSSAVGTAMSMAPALLTPQGDDASTTTRSGISQGTIDIRNGDTSAVANLDRELTELQQTGLKPIFDEQEVRENMEAGQLAGQVAFRAAGDIARAVTKEYDQAQWQKQGAEAALAILNDPNATADQRASVTATPEQLQAAIAQADLVMIANQDKYDLWKDGGTGKTILHAVAGALAASLGGGDALGGAMGAGAAELGRPLTAGESSLVQDLVSATIGAAAGGGSGAAAGLAGEQFNRQLHTDEIDFVKNDKRVAEYAALYGLTEEQARQELMRAAAAMVDKSWTETLSASGWDVGRATEFIKGELPAGGNSALFALQGDEYNNSRIGLKELLTNKDYLAYSLDYLALVNPATYQSDPRYAAIIADARSQGSTDGFRAGAEGAVAGPSYGAMFLMSALAEPGMAFDILKDAWTDFTYTGADQTLQVMQGNIYGAVYDFENMAASSGVGTGLSAVVGALVPSSKLVAGEAKIPWGKGIQAQGLLWEDILEPNMPPGSRLPEGFTTFDFFDDVTGVAVSAKTLDTTTLAKYNTPSAVYSSIKGNIDSVVRFSKPASKGGRIVDPVDIKAREVHLAVPTSTTAAQWVQIRRAIEYGKQQGVTVKVTPVNGGGG